MNHTKTNLYCKKTPEFCNEEEKTTKNYKEENFKTTTTTTTIIVAVSANDDEWLAFILRQAREIWGDLFPLWCIALAS